MLPGFRTNDIEPFAVTGVDFAGPLKYKETNKSFGKCYVALFTCASTRAVYLKLCHDLTAEEFQSFKRVCCKERTTPNYYQ